MNEFRKDILNGNRVIIAPARNERKKDFVETKSENISSPKAVSDCPFCTGNESMLTEILFELRDDSHGCWKTRAVLNKYPAVEKADTENEDTSGMYQTVPAAGFHEVIIETPVHSLSPAEMSLEELGPVIETYRIRYQALYQNDEIETVLIFRNHGPGAGTSLRHPHSQIIALKVLPEYVQRQINNCRAFYLESGQCLFCEMIRSSADNQQRIFFQNEHFTALVPFWAKVPYEIFIVPNEHQHDFVQMNDDTQKEFAFCLSAILRALKKLLNDPDYNYIVHSRHKIKDEEKRYLHWYLQILPESTETAGFEKGSGISINPSVPERDAENLSKCVRAILEEINMD